LVGSSFARQQILRASYVTFSSGPALSSSGRFTLVGFVVTPGSINKYPTTQDRRII
jgi:hypothetical protein